MIKVYFDATTSLHPPNTDISDTSFVQSIKQDAILKDVTHATNMIQRSQKGQVFTTTT